MREYKFRGKDRESGKFVYGHFIEFNNRFFINKWAFGPDLWDLTETDFYEVEPDSLKQFTGLHYIDGDEIYEGDEVEFTYNLGKTIKGVVEWSKGGYYILRTTDDKFNNKVIPHPVEIHKSNIVHNINSQQYKKCQKEDLIGKKFYLNLNNSISEIKVISFSGVYIDVQHSNINKTQKIFIDDFEKLLNIEIIS